MKKTIYFILFLICFSFPDIYAVGGGSDGIPVMTGLGGTYKVMLDVFDIGGRSHTSSSYTEYYSLGEPGGITRLSGGNYILQSGYYCQIFPPGGITTLSALPGTYGRTVKLTWTAPGEEEYSGIIVTGNYAIQRSSYNGSLITWTTGNAQILFSTSSVSPSTSQTYTLTSLLSGVTYYVRIWTQNSESDWSGISNGATNWAQIAVLSVRLIEPNTYFNFGSMGTNLTTVSSSGIVVRNDGTLRETYNLSVTTGTSPPANTVWNISTDATNDNDEFVLYAIFKTTQPLSGDFGDTLGNDILSTGTFTSSQTNFASATPPETDGLNVEPYVAKQQLNDTLISDTTIWFKFKSPLATTTTAQQQIILVITAQEEN